MGVTSHGGGNGCGNSSPARASARRTAATAWRMASSAEILPAESRSAPNTSSRPDGPGLQLGDLIQAGLVQFLRRPGQGGEDPDGPGVVLLPARQPDQPGPVGRPGPRQQLP